jgi:hypothetical protein
MIRAEMTHCNEGPSIWWTNAGNFDRLAIGTRDAIAVTRSYANEVRMKVLRNYMWLQLTRRVETRLMAKVRHQCWVDVSLYRHSGNGRYQSGESNREIAGLHD